jgi:hypothetical protein
MGKNVGNIRTVYKSSREGRRRAGLRAPVEVKKFPDQKLVGDVAVLNIITEGKAEVIAAENALRRNVRLARRSGVSWQRIAVALGVTHQSACSKYGPYPVNSPRVPRSPNRAKVVVRDVTPLKAK